MDNNEYDLTKIFRKCFHCNKEMNLTNFAKCKSLKYGRAWMCNDCNRIRSAEYRKKNPEKARAAVRKSQAKNPASVLRATRKYQQKKREERKAEQEKND